MHALSLSDNHRIRRFLAAPVAAVQQIPPPKFVLWLLLGFCVLTTALVIRAAIASYLTGAPAPLRFW